MKLTSDNKMLEYELMKAYSNISCFSTTRQGGCSRGAYASLNCTHYCGDRQEDVMANREIVMQSLPQRPEHLIIPRQTHTSNVRLIDESFFHDEPSLQEQKLENVDALITSVFGCCICISTADCVPVLLFDPEHQVVAAIHAGWRGTVSWIVKKTLYRMHECYGTRASTVIACIGPSISLESFEVGDEVYQAFDEAGFDMSRIAVKKEKWHLDLWEANRLQLLDFGIPPTQIEIAGICTYQHVDQFFSARRLGIHSGRMLSGIMLHKEK